MKTITHATLFILCFLTQQNLSAMHNQADHPFTQEIIDNLDAHKSYNFSQPRESLAPTACEALTAFAETKLAAENPNLLLNFRLRQEKEMRDAKKQHKNIEWRHAARLQAKNIIDSHIEALRKEEQQRQAKENAVRARVNTRLVMREKIKSVTREIHDCCSMLSEFLEKIPGKDKPMLRKSVSLATTLCNKIIQASSEWNQNNLVRLQETLTILQNRIDSIEKIHPKRWQRQCKCCQMKKLFLPT